jgi:hypothetical protein
MKQILNFPVLFFLFGTTVLGVPVNTDSNTPWLVTAGQLAHAAAAPIGGLFWLNGAISGSKDTNRNSTPTGALHTSIHKLHLSNNIFTV